MQTVQVVMYLRQGWNDPRLAYEHQSAGSAPSSIRVFQTDRIWVPDTFFRKDLGSSVVDQTVPNVLGRLDGRGDVWYVMK